MSSSRMNIAVGDSLFVSHITYKYTRNNWSFDAQGKRQNNPTVEQSVQTIGPYTHKTPIKGMISRFRDQHSNDIEFDILSIKTHKTDFNWIEVGL